MDFIKDFWWIILMIPVAIYSRKFFDRFDQHGRGGSKPENEE
jgi:hypothetical protein